jgi:hypothetical protein
MKKFIVIAILSVFGIAAYSQGDVNDKGYCYRFFLCEDGVLFAKYSKSNNSRTLVKFPQNKNISSYTIPSDVSTIAKGAFQGNKYIRTIKIPSGLTYIGDNAFDGCDQLTSIEIYESTSAARAVEADNSPSEAKEVGRYNIQGVKVQEDEEGQVQIILYSDGKSQKVLK